MKVLVVGTGGRLSGSGVTSVADQMVRSLARMGHEPVRAVVGDRPRARPNRINVENVTAVLREGVQTFVAARRVRPDVVWLHVLGAPTLPALRALLQALAVRLTGSRVIVEMHAPSLAEQMAVATSAQRLVTRWIGRVGVILVALNADDASALASVACGARVEVVPNWVDLPSAVTPAPATPPFVAVFVGSLIRRKGLPELLSAMRLLEDLPLYLRVVGAAGDDGPEAAEALRAQAADLVERGTVTFVGAADRAAVRDELRVAHLLVLPSRREGLPISVLEALSEGRPVVVADTGATAQLVRDSGCGLVASEVKPSEIAETLRLAISDPESLVRMGKLGRGLVRNAYSEAAVTPVLDRLLRASVLGR